MMNSKHHVYCCKCVSFSFISYFTFWCLSP